MNGSLTGPGFGEKIFDMWHSIGYNRFIPKGGCRTGTDTEVIRMMTGNGGLFV